MVTVEKKNSDRVHICIDPRPLNKALLWEHYHLPTLQEILPELSKAKVFSKCGLHSGYWHVPLDAEPWKLTCTQSPFGRFVSNRLPFGPKVASEFFKKWVHAALADLPGIYCVVDNVLIAGTGEDLQAASTSLNANLDAFLKRCSEKSIVLNPN